MRIVARRHLAEFAEQHADERSSLAQWERLVRASAWISLSDVQASLQKAKALGGDRVRFEVSGGAYRLVAAFDFARQIAFIKFIGSHAEYDRVDALRVSQF